MKKQATTTETFIDPVCLMKVDPGNKNFTTMYQMRSYYFCAEACRKAFEVDPEKYLYYFCAEACRKAFEVDPEKYLGAKTSKRKGWWGRYLDRLEKATGGRAPQCH
jgi:YHS domain-containing protein